MYAELWQTRDRAVFGAGLALGLMLVGLAWRQSGRTADGAVQLAWLEVGITGVVATAFTTALWIRSGRRAVCRRRVLLLDRLVIGPGAAAVPGAGADESLLPLATARGGRYHRPSCALVAGRTALPAERDAHDAAGRIPCEVCRP